MCDRRRARLALWVAAVPTGVGVQMERMAPPSTGIIAPVM